MLSLPNELLAAALSDGPGPDASPGSPGASSGGPGASFGGPGVSRDALISGN